MRSPPPFSGELIFAVRPWKGLLGESLVEDTDTIGDDETPSALESEGYAVVAAVDGVDALDVLRAAATLPRLILLDLMMPRLRDLFGAVARFVPSPSATG